MSAVCIRKDRQPAHRAVAGRWQPRHAPCGVKQSRVLKTYHPRPAYVTSVAVRSGQYVTGTLADTRAPIKRRMQESAGRGLQQEVQASGLSSVWCMIDDDHLTMYATCGAKLRHVAHSRGKTRACLAWVYRMHASQQFDWRRLNPRRNLSTSQAPVGCCSTYSVQLLLLSCNPAAEGACDASKPLAKAAAPAP